MPGAASLLTIGAIRRAHQRDGTACGCNLPPRAPHDGPRRPSWRAAAIRRRSCLSRRRPRLYGCVCGSY